MRQRRGGRAARLLAVLAVVLGMLGVHRYALTARAVGAVAAPAGATCGADCSDVAALCLAVLFGAGLALLLARRRTSCLSLARTRCRAPAPPVRHARGPDPVKELSVSRT
jgi:hypothetical protein